MRNLLFVFLGTLLLDQISKLAVLFLMQPGESIPLLSDFVRITFVRNSGAAFGLLSGNSVAFLLLMTTLAIVALLFLLLRSRRDDVRVSYYLILVLAGAVGNLLDRLRFGEVVDFIDIGWKNVRWPVFNLADSAVTVGVLLFLYHSLLRRRPAG